MASLNPPDLTFADIPRYTRPLGPMDLLPARMVQVVQGHRERLTRRERQLDAFISGLLDVLLKHSAEDRAILREETTLVHDDVFSLDGEPMNARDFEYLFQRIFLLCDDRDDAQRETAAVYRDAVYYALQQYINKYRTVAPLSKFKMLIDRCYKNRSG